MGGKSVPTDYKIESTLKGNVDIDLDNIHIREVAPVTLNTAITNIPPLDIRAAVTQIPTIRLEMAIKEIPKLDLDIGIKPTRVSMPMNTHVCLRVLGLKLLDLSLCGENMLILEPYVPRKAERGCA